MDSSQARQADGGRTYRDRGSGGNRRQCERSAAETVYTNFNTVPGLVNGYPNQDTYSLDSEYFPVGGMVEFPRTRATRIKALSVQVDSFTCEHGVYSLENCFTLRAKPFFKYQMTAKIFAVGASNEPIGAAARDIDSKR